MSRKKKNRNNGSSKKVKEETVTSTEDGISQNSNTDIDDADGYDGGDDGNHNSPQALQFKEQGNVYYGKREYQKAVEAYQAGLDSLSCAENASVAIALRSNLAMTLLKLELFDLADIECSRILKVDPRNVKGAFVRSFGILWDCSENDDDCHIIESLVSLTRLILYLFVCLSVVL